MKSWYAVHTHPNGEHRALANLNNQGFEVYLPYYTRTRRHARRADQVKAPLFPRYLFVRINVQQAGWRAINGTFGVSNLVSLGDRPSPVPNYLIEEIRRREDESGAVRLSRIVRPNPGDHVRFLAGPMMGQIGIFECERDEDRVVILLDLVGRSTRVTAPSDVVTVC